MTPGETWQGVKAALEAPRWIDAEPLAQLVALPADAPQRAQPEPERALRAARRTLRLLARVPGGRWRASCLYESIAECLVLRRAGVPAALCIGVKRATDGGPGIAAHAWVARTSGERSFHGYATMDVLEELKAQR